MPFWRERTRSTGGGDRGHLIAGLGCCHDKRALMDDPPSGDLAAAFDAEFARPIIRANCLYSGAKPAIELPPVGRETEIEIVVRDACFTGDAVGLRERRSGSGEQCEGENEFQHGGFLCLAEAPHLNPFRPHDQQMDGP